MREPQKNKMSLKHTLTYSLVPVLDTEFPYLTNISTYNKENH